MSGESGSLTRQSYLEAEGEAATVGCLCCGEGDPERECPESVKPCGHHCNHVWTHDSCCWCGWQVPSDG